MTKKEFFQTLEDVKVDRLFITDSIDRVDKEIEHNCWAISLPAQMEDQFTEQELESFLAEVKENRRLQLIQSKVNVGLIYYIWMDEQASQLRFNFINSNHSQLPFYGRPLFFVETEKEILARFLGHNPGEDEAFTFIYKEIIE